MNHIILFNSLIRYLMDNTTCKAFMEQKNAKGKQCWRPPKENGFCGIHQKHALLKKASDEGQTKCRTHRCIEIVDSSDYVYCKNCIDKKELLKSTVQICKATIEQGPTKGTPCARRAKPSSDYCGKHIDRQLLIHEAQAQQLRICDDGKRACKKFTTDKKLLCDDCLEKCREYDNALYNIRKETQNICITCGIHIDTTILGENETNVQKCQVCYAKMKNIEKKRIREERNYNVERKNNTEKHYTEYKKSALQRNIWFELTKDEFKSTVGQPCFYCESYNENEVIGIDRLYSDLGYCMKNCVPCCKVCNVMKNDLSPLEFVNHLQKFTKEPIRLSQIIHTKLLDSQTIESFKQSHKSYIRQNALLKIIKSGELDAYITICKEESRSDEYIKNIESLRQYTTKSNLVIRNEIYKILQH